MADPEKPFFRAEASGGPPRRSHHTSLTPEAKLWRSFRNTELASGLPNAVTHLDFSPASPHDLAASSSASVLLYHGNNLTPKPFSPITHFPDLAYSPSFRPLDGSLLAAGDHSGLVILLDPSKSRPPLRRIRAHSRPARLVRFLPDRTHLFSAGDDASIHIWDISSSSSTPLTSLPSAHRDYIRAGAPSPSSPDLLASGSYDHHVKLWDLRSPPSAPIADFSHGSPVESLLFLPSGSLLATAGGNSVKLWDAVAGFRLLHSMESHNKTVTSISLATLPSTTTTTSSSSRLLSASLDGYLKVFDFSSLRLTHSTRYPSMLLSVASSPSGLVRAVGTSTGVIYISRKQTKKNVDADEIGLGGAKPPPPLRPSNYRYFHRGQSDKPREGDYLLKGARSLPSARTKLAEHDKLLKKFRHKEALVSVLGRLRHGPAGVVAVLEELVSRKKLMRCLGNLDEGELGMLLSFLHKYATMPTHARFLINLARKVIHMRSDDLGKSDQLKLHVGNLNRMVKEEIKIQVALQELKGMLSPLIASAAR